jgi:hypothetical protein
MRSQPVVCFQPRYALNKLATAGAPAPVAGDGGGGRGGGGGAYCSWRTPKCLRANDVCYGTITQAELNAVAGDRRRRRRDREAALADRPSTTSRRHERQVLRAIYDLLHDLAASGGEDEENVEHSRAEIDRLRG